MIVVSAIFVVSCGQTHTHTRTDADEHFTSVTVVGVSNYDCVDCVTVCVVRCQICAEAIDTVSLFHRIISNCLTAC